MSAFYGTLVSDKGVSTRAGHRFIKAVAQSHEGSVAVAIDDGEVLIYVGEGSTINGRELLRVPLDKLVRAGGLAIKKEKRT
jgi:hypothetical protein